VESRSEGGASDKRRRAGAREGRVIKGGEEERPMFFGVEFGI